MTGYAEDIGLATVYRVLTQFEQAGLVTRHNSASDHSVFELESGLHHDHMVCLACGKIEEFHILFLDRKNVLIKDERQQRGTIDHTPVYTREVIKRALELGASALILVHNHPSGDPAPSCSDISVTNDIRK